MSKKRLIFVLLYRDGQFCISRNFRLQRVGNADWLARNYNFSKVSRFIDELVILNVDNAATGTDKFLDNVAQITAEVFIPVALGGTIRGPEDAVRYFDHGADKVVVNTLLWQRPDAVRAIGDVYGEQALMASVDYRLVAGTRMPHLRGDALPDVGNLSAWLGRVADLGVGEILLNSVDKDGTGVGLDLDAFAAVPESIHQPFVLMGGVGRTDHFLPGIELPRVSGVATSNLFAFIGEGLASSRRNLLEAGVDMASWN